MPNFRHTTLDECLARAHSLLGKVNYVLGAGGRNPEALDPQTNRTFKRPDGSTFERYGCDCAGFVLWSWGLDRLQPDFNFYGGWINTDSMIHDGTSSREFFQEIWYPDVGSIIVFPSVNLDNDSNRERIGHVGLVVEAPNTWDPANPDYSQLQVIHCAGSNWKLAGGDKATRNPAVLETSGKIWNGKDSYKGHTNPKWRTRLLHYVKAAPTINAVPSVNAVVRPILAYGSSGQFVRMLQEALKLHGFPALMADGDFGHSTLTAIVDFQRRSGLTADGIVGPKTWAALAV